MMRNKKIEISLKVLMIVISLALIPAPTLAASQDECSIWLCMPQGFAPSACKKARKALVKRIFKGKSPLPSLSSCMSGGNSGSESQTISYEQNYVVKTKDGNWQNTRYCMKRFLRLGVCHRSLTLYNDGIQQGESYIFNEYIDDIK